MKANLYSIKDCVSGAFLAPNCFPSDLVFRRALASAVNGPKGSLVSDYPKDCQAYKVGEFDDETGVIISQEPKFLWNLVDLIQSEE